MSKPHPRYLGLLDLRECPSTHPGSSRCLCLRLISSLGLFPLRCVLHRHFLFFLRRSHHHLFLFLLRLTAPPNDASFLPCPHRSLKQVVSGQCLDVDQSLAAVDVDANSPALSSHSTLF
ncbi:hypothetical protein Taro_013602 [Colocasia esculenta]|uniref:Uncharacterized protein n=1 Tax=Colocasia esculenta TaxID=4460 RepID=A0A843U6Y2_COLES|nr:hypothetical protein [Colocasia esculenta]